MHVSYKRCPLCKSENPAEFLKASDYLLTSETFTLFKCQACGFVFTQDVPPADEIGKYYQSNDYVSHSDSRKGFMNKLYHLGRSFMLKKKYSMVRQSSNGKKLLDIGTGTGYFPGFMKSKGYRVTGVEIDPKAREFARKEFGFDVYSPDEFLHGKISGKFDVITLWHVLEHLEDFDLYLEKMLAQLDPDGTLLIALPNCSSFDARHYKETWAGYDVPRHLWHFTPSTLNILAAKHVLKVNKMKRLPLDPFYNSMLSEKYRGNKLFMISGMIIGKLAYIESLFNIEKSSSVVYFLVSARHTIQSRTNNQ
jgi:2-polyprenyl-3-methyl-5-hydroxy-6-metoxy-1,4-benzoquinol methylase